ncbi:AGE family epimerase/isomerase [Thermoflavifilum thermophilum]|uniref:Mannobiose 2-epimerase n=1 Tax=Thermoflavifilum thermophilum TaxID=1393122 RepID=A0A1I7NI76_9BACT|nr:AGE family epimerase/isomerase [Thermoflavifilum thermophilum]SFV34352.1 mannobiose 2-epimerase [Thermoflavifilum thermophilum]
MHTTETFQQLAEEWEMACQRILQWWMEYGIDPSKKFFYGEVSNSNKPNLAASKGLVMHARIMWSFAEAYCFFQLTDYLQIALQVEHIIDQFFHDAVYDGYYWKINSIHQPEDHRKMLYGQAFVLYAYVSLYKATHESRFLHRALSIFHCIETHAHGNYYYEEAFDQRWKLLPDARLDEQEPIFVYSLNAHLHLMEAYTALYTVYHDAYLLSRLLHIAAIIQEKFYQNGHLILWMQQQDKPASYRISPGHEIETAWLMLDMMKITSYENVEWRDMINELGQQVLKHFYTHNGLLEPMHPPEKQWWAQAEAMTGFLYVYYFSRNEMFLKACVDIWKWIQEYLIDEHQGEWFWGTDAHNRILMHRYKAGFWKGPYHAVRALIQNITLSQKLHT